MLTASNTESTFSLINKVSVNPNIGPVFKIIKSYICFSLRFSIKFLKFILPNSFEASGASLPAVIISKNLLLSSTFIALSQDFKSLKRISESP